MLEKLRAQWREFRRARPGHRFQDRYKRSRETRASQSRLVRFLKPAAGIILLAAGLVFCVLPGPGLPLIVIGAGLLADGSLFVARSLDRLELYGRSILNWGRRKLSRKLT